jgi:hypothetical protein
MDDLSGTNIVSDITELLVLTIHRTCYACSATTCCEPPETKQIILYEETSATLGLLQPPP